MYSIQEQKTLDIVSQGYDGSLNTGTQEESIPPAVSQKDEGRSKQRRRARRAAERALSTQGTTKLSESFQESLEPSECKSSEGPSLLHAENGDVLSGKDIWKLKVEHAFSGFLNRDSLNGIVPDASLSKYQPPGLESALVAHTAGSYNPIKGFTPIAPPMLGLRPPGLVEPESVMPISGVHPQIMTYVTPIRGSSNMNDQNAGAKVMEGKFSDTSSDNFTSAGPNLNENHHSARASDKPSNSGESLLANFSIKAPESSKTESWRDSPGQRLDNTPTKLASLIRVEDLEKAFLAAAVEQTSSRTDLKDSPQNKSHEESNESKENFETSLKKDDRENDKKIAEEVPDLKNKKHMQVNDGRNISEAQLAVHDLPENDIQGIVESSGAEQYKEANVDLKLANSGEVISTIESAQDYEDGERHTQHDQLGEQRIAEEEKTTPVICDSSALLAGNMNKKQKKEVATEKKLISKIPASSEPSDMSQFREALKDYIPWLADVVGPFERYIRTADVYFPLLVENWSIMDPENSDMVSVLMHHTSSMRVHFLKRIESVQRKRNRSSSEVFSDPFYNFIEAAICQAVLQKKFKNQRDTDFLARCLGMVYRVMCTLFVEELSSGDPNRLEKMSQIQEKVTSLLECVFQVGKEYNTPIVEMLSKIQVLMHSFASLLLVHLSQANYSYNVVRDFPVRYANLLTIVTDLKLSVTGAQVKSYDDQFHHRKNMLLKSSRTEGLFSSGKFIEQEYNVCTTSNIPGILNQLKRAGGEILASLHQYSWGQREMKMNKTSDNLARLSRSITNTITGLFHRDVRASEPLYADIVSWVSLYLQNLTSRLEDVAMQLMSNSVEFYRIVNAAWKRISSELQSCKYMVRAVETFEFESGRESQIDRNKIYGETMYDYIACLERINRGIEKYGREHITQASNILSGSTCFVASLQLAYCFKLYEKPKTEYDVVRRKELMGFAISQLKHGLKETLNSLFAQSPPTPTRRKQCFMVEANFLDSFQMALPEEYCDCMYANYPSIWADMPSDWREADDLGKVFSLDRLGANRISEPPELIDNEGGEDDKEVMEVISKLEIGKFSDLNKFFYTAPMKEANAKDIVRAMLKRDTKFNIISAEDFEEWDDYSFKGAKLDAQKLAENWSGFGTMDIRLDDLNSMLLSKKESVDAAWSDFCFSLEDPRFS